MFVLRINIIERDTATYEVGEGWAKVTVVDRGKYRESATCFLSAWYVIYMIDRSQYSRFVLTNWRDAFAIY